MQKIFAVYEAAEPYRKAFETYYKTAKANRNKNTFTIAEIAEKFGINVKDLHIIISNENPTEILTFQLCLIYTFILMINKYYINKY